MARWGSCDFSQLKKLADRLDKLEAGDLDKAFEYAHALKGVTGNLALTPIDRPVREITEFLRSRTDMDYGPLLAEILSQRDALRELCR